VIQDRAVVPWNWRELDADGALRTWSAVSFFVDWLVGRYDLAEVIPRCWYRHGAFTEELTALWAAHIAAYVDDEAPPDAPIIWHERFAACRERLAAWDRLACATRGHRDEEPAIWELDAEDFTGFVAVDCAGRPGAQRFVLVPPKGTEPPDGPRRPDPPSGER
jgi:hypothetical protein